MIALKYVESKLDSSIAYIENLLIRFIFGSWYYTSLDMYDKCKTFRSDTEYTY